MRQGSFISRNAALIAIIVATTAIHLLLAFRFPLAEDETYYWEWSRRLDWGYYDQGPFIAWWIRAFCAIFGDTVLGVRAGTIVAYIVSQIFLFLLGRDLFGKSIALISVAILSVTPLAIAGGFLATYDPLMIMFWSIALYFAYRALTQGGWTTWLILGAAFGFGLLSKYTMFLFALCLLAFLLITPQYRVWLKRPQPWIAFALGLAILLPNIMWLKEHDWVTIKHVGLIGGATLNQTPAQRVLTYFGSQAIVISPLLFLLMVWALIWAGRDAFAVGPSDKSSVGKSFVFWFSAPVLGFFLLNAFRGKVLANWPAPGWITASLALGAWQAAPDQRRGLRWALAAAGAGLSVLLTLPLVLSELPASLGLTPPKQWLRAENEMFGVAELGQAAGRLREEMQTALGSPVALGGIKYQVSSRLAFATPGQPRTCCLFLGTRLNNYIYWNADAVPKAGGAMVLVLDRLMQEIGDEEIRKAFDRVDEKPEVLPIYRKALYDEPVKTYYLYRCYGFRPDPEWVSPAIK